MCASPGRGRGRSGALRGLQRRLGRRHRGELLRGSTILGEKENVAPGIRRAFTLRLAAGSYTVACPDARQASTPFTVTAAPTAAATTAAAASPRGTTAVPGSPAAALQAAVTGYHAYVVAEVAELARAATRFTDAVRAGDVARAKRLYPLAREHYESVEPVAESFGDLDARIDLREADLSGSARWTGFHRIEKGLWVAGSTAGLAPVADQLDRDVAALGSLVAKASYQPAQLANGASSLLDEIGATKVTGEEDAFSHTDLFDVAANVAGARAAFDLLAPALASADPGLAASVRARFADVGRVLAPLRTSDGWVDYRRVGQGQRRALAQAVDALAEPLSTVAAKVA